MLILNGFSKDSSSRSASLLHGLHTSINGQSLFGAPIERARSLYERSQVSHHAAVVAVAVGWQKCISVFVESNLSVKSFTFLTRPQFQSVNPYLLTGKKIDFAAGVATSPGNKAEFPDLIIVKRLGRFQIQALVNGRVLVKKVTGERTLE